MAFPCSSCGSVVCRALYGIFALKPLTLVPKYFLVRLALRTISLTLPLCGVPFIALAAPDDGAWQAADSLPLVVGQAWVKPVASRAFHLDHTVLRTRLERAPREFTTAATQAPAEISLPMPDGSMARFRVTESPIMAPELAAKFPEIKTYSGQGLDDPTATARFDVTPTGLHAQILSPRGVVYVDPERRGDARRHLSYFKRDLRRDGAGFQCLVPGDDAGLFFPAADFLPASSGTTLRTYRLAVGATGEYTQFHGGTVASGLAAIVTAINRVNGIYETELAIRLVLVANNNLIVYTNPATDPYSNDNGNNLVSQNQGNLDIVIGDANYDVGHVFSTDGGGLAAPAVVCLPGSKARGETGLPQPVGDAFYVDFVAHELGHQFGAHHSFNGVDGNCNGQRTSGTAFEPGSGSTVMSYAGICANDDVQTHSDAFFHSVSYDEIQFYVTTGFGADCPVLTPTANNPPAITAGPNFTIPRGTPFTLTASGSDVDGHPLTYCWEERDLGPAQALGGADNGSSPLFRTFTPTTSPSRTLPQLTNLLNNISSDAEQLPATSRTMNFRVTARDHRAGGGGVNAANMSVTVSAAAGPFVVTSPNTPVSWSGQRTVTWNVAGTSNAPVNASAVNILLSTNGGLDYPFVLATNTPNDGAQSVLLPNLATSSARLKVQGVGNIFFDISDSNFSITPFVPLPLISIESLQITAEGCAPGNGAADPGETVTVSFALRNTGTAATTNLVATLLNIGGVTAASAPQNYGALAPGGAAVARSFTFTVNGACGSNIAPRLQLQDGAMNLGTASQPMTLGAIVIATNSFASTAAISVPTRNAATPYPATITVSGLSNPVMKLTATLSNLTHTAPDDLDILLVGPTGQTVLLMSDTGGTADANSVTLIFDDAAVASLPEGTQISSGTFRPTNGTADESFSSPAPSQPYGTVLSAFNGLNPNGAWSLYVWDDANQNSGSLANGWRLTFTTQSGPVCCVNAPPPLVSIARAGADARLTFATVSGVNYRLECTDTLAATNTWNTVTGAAVVFGTGAPVQITDTNALASPQRFYRVRVLP